MTDLRVWSVSVTTADSFAVAHTAGLAADGSVHRVTGREADAQSSRSSRDGESIAASNSFIT